jgi:hypothetical protein
VYDVTAKEIGHINNPFGDILSNEYNSEFFITKTDVGTGLVLDRGKSEKPRYVLPSFHKHKPDGILVGIMNSKEVSITRNFLGTYFLD